MKASWWQTILLAMIGAALPFGAALTNGGAVSIKTVIAAVITAGLAGLANVLRSPVEDPPTMVKGNDPSQLSGSR